MPGRSRLAVPEERLGLRIPVGLHEEMVGVIRAANQWKDRQNFILEAIKEKTERWKKEHPMWSAPAKDRK
ncbi:MAG TPA: hypothetical protein VMG81_05380 [Thermoplasmata archaeon]|nr:hypothetical protein [Thermoplasmata archaeon]